MLQILPWSLKSVPLAEASHHTVNTLKLPCREARMKRSWPAPTCAWVTRKWILLPQSNLQVTAIQADTFFSNWRIIALQYCVGFCHTSTWISHKHIYIYVSYLLNLPWLTSWLHEPKPPAKLLPNSWPAGIMWDMVPVVLSHKILRVMWYTAIWLTNIAFCWSTVKKILYSKNSLYWLVCKHSLFTHCYLV